MQESSKDKIEYNSDHINARWWIADDKSLKLMLPAVGDNQPAFKKYDTIRNCSAHSVKQKLSTLKALDPEVQDTLMEIKLQDERVIYLQPKNALVPNKSKAHHVFLAKCKSSKKFKKISSSTMSTSSFGCWFL